MKKIGIFYGSNTGSTEEVAREIAKRLDVNTADIINVANAMPDVVANYDVLVMGTSTWGDGEMQEDWEDFIHAISVMDLSDKKIALFGTGDENMTDSFCDGVGKLYDKLTDTGAKFIGKFNVEGYEFNHSDAVKELATAVGLLIDNVNCPQLTEARIDKWVELLKSEI